MLLKVGNVGNVCVRVYVWLMALPRPFPFFWLMLFCCFHPFLDQPIHPADPYAFSTASIKNYSWFRSKTWLTSTLKVVKMQASQFQAVCRHAIIISFCIGNLETFVAFVMIDTMLDIYIYFGAPLGYFNRVSGPNVLHVWTKWLDRKTQQSNFAVTTLWSIRDIERAFKGSKTQLPPSIYPLFEHMQNASKIEKDANRRKVTFEVSKFQMWLCSNFLMKYNELLIFWHVYSK